MMMNILPILLILVLLPLAVRAQSFVDVSTMSAANDSARVSLLTCAPGTSLYRLYVRMVHPTMPITTDFLA